MTQDPIPDEARTAIKQTLFKELKDDVAIEVYTKQGENDTFNESTIALVKALAELSEKLKVSLHLVGDGQAVKRNVTRSPTVLIAPEKYRLRYTGAPVGEETRSLLLVILMASNGKTVLSPGAAAKIREQLHEKRDIRVFVSPT